MGQCCYCCLSEEDKIVRVLQRFPGTPVSQAEDTQLQKLVGRVVLAGSQPFYAPASGAPCVYYRINVQEEVEKITMRENPQTHQKERHVSHEWRSIFFEERFSDFYLQDGISKVFIPGSDKGHCKVQSMNSSRKAGTGIFDQAPPPGIQRIIGSNVKGHRWGRHDDRTGKYKYIESSLDVNELVCALGVVAGGVDRYTNQPIKIMQQFTANTLNEEYFEKQNWEQWDINAWTDLTEKTSVVLISDSPTFTSGVQVQPISNLPPWMAQPTTTWEMPVVQQAPPPVVYEQKQPVAQQAPVEQRYQAPPVDSIPGVVAPVAPVAPEPAPAASTTQLQAPKAPEAAPAQEDEPPPPSFEAFVNNR